MSITAFPDGNSLPLHFHPHTLAVGNSGGVLKLFNTEQRDLEPRSIDIEENITALAQHDAYVVVTSTGGQLELIHVPSGTNKGRIYRSELPLRAVEFINGGKRAVCGGDTDQLTIVDMETKQITHINTGEQVTGLSYSYASELLAVSLANATVQIYSVINEEPTLLHTLRDVLPPKIHMSTDKIDYEDEHGDELVCTTAQWSGRECYVPGVDAIHVYDGIKWTESVRKIPTDGRVVDFKVSGDRVAVLYRDGVHVVGLAGETIEEEVLDLDGALAISVTWMDDKVAVGSSNGEVVQVQVKRKSGLFVEAEAEEDGEDEENGVDVEQGVVEGDGQIEEDFLIDDDDEEEAGEIEDLDRPRKKRALARPVEYRVAPFPTPWISQGNAQRRYLTMNSVGYVWAVKDPQADSQSITVSFFDRSVHKDYHITDIHSSDVCALSTEGLLLASSQGSRGRIFYRTHDSENDAWERPVPLGPEERLTAAAIGGTHVAVGTSAGYLRVFSGHGVCLSISKALPVAALVSSRESVILSVHEASPGAYTYSMVDVDQDGRFLQQDVRLPLGAGAAERNCPLIKGLFFNERSDPCLVAGHDDMLMVLQGWRETGNARWVPVLDCRSAVTENSENKSAWRCWPLGMYADTLNCLVLKNGGVYPGFPLPLPVDLAIKMPVAEWGSDDPEEEFLRALTMGKLVSASLGDVEDSELVDRLTEYSVMFDRSLLKMFAEACKESRLARALSVAKMMKTDKALGAAEKIAERLEFVNLGGRVRELRENIQ